VRRSANNQLCFAVTHEVEWDEFGRLQAGWVFGPLEMASNMGARFHVTCRPLPNLLPAYTIKHEIDLADMIAGQ
jgi:hypothetical protein